MKKYKVAYFKTGISWARPGLFDKYLIKSLLSKSDVDLYIPDDTYKPDGYFEGKNKGNFRVVKFNAKSPSIISSIKVFFKIKSLQDQYDFFITDAAFLNLGNGMIDSKKSVLYYQSPERSFYDLREYRLKTKSFFRRIIQHIWLLQRPIDNSIIRRCKNAKLFANSRNVAKRIMKYYSKSSIVLHPAPADRKGFTEEKIKGLKFKNYFLVVNRIVPEKRLELVIEVFNKLRSENLVIVGWNPDFKYNNKIKKLVSQAKNIVYYNKISDENIEWLYNNMKAVIQTNLEEDFGMVPVEAMDHGKPAIVVKEGGFKETVVSGFNGEFLTKPYDKSLLKTIKSFSASKYDSKEIKKYIEKYFSVARFERELWTHLEGK